MCPRCGKSVESEIHVPLSQAGDGKIEQRCSCGEYFTYKTASYDANLARSQQEDLKRRTKILETLSKPYKIFATLLVIAAFAANLVAAIAIGVTSDKGVITKVVGGIVFFVIFSFITILLADGAFSVKKSVQDEYDGAKRKVSGGRVTRIICCSLLASGIMLWGSLSVVGF
jgi:hypothetical protein